MTKPHAPRARYSVLLACAGAALSLGAGSQGPPPSPSDDQGSGEKYVATKYLPGLDETVRVEKEPGQVLVFRSKGPPVSLAEILAWERVAYRARFHAMTQSLYANVLQANPNDAFPIAITFRLPIDWDALTARLRSPQDAEPARRELEAAIAGAGGRLTSWLAQRGIGPVAVAKSIPVVTVTASATAVLSLYHNPEVVSIMGTNASIAPQGSFDPGKNIPNGIRYLRSDSGFNHLGFYGPSQRIGYVEARPGSALYQIHPAFANMSFTYAQAPATCNVTGIGDCRFAATDANTCVDNLTGAGKQCVVFNHTSQGVSVVGAIDNSGVEYGASRAHIYVPNGNTKATLDMTPCSGGIVNTFDWLRVNGVKTVNESYVCHQGRFGGPTTTIPDPIDGPTEDWYARLYDITTVKAADDFADRNACVFTSNSICVSGLTNSDVPRPLFAYLNPSGSDREEPDVAALADSVDIIDRVGEHPPAGPVGWTYLSGNSFAAPAITGFAALLREACQGAGGVILNALDVRAIIRNAGWVQNVSDEPYSTPTFGRDWRDGGGVPGSEAALAYCGITFHQEGYYTPPSALARGILDLDSGPSIPPGLGPRTSIRIAHTVTSAALTAGDRFRATVSWDSCPMSTTLSYSAPLGTDLDLYLYNRTLGRYLKPTSQSTDDTNEGFDLIVPDGWDGEYDLLIGYSKGSGCPTMRTEAYSAAWSHWKGLRPRPVTCSADGSRGAGGSAAGLFLGALAIVGFSRRRNQRPILSSQRGNVEL